jgi:hypothetical protein
VIFEHHHLPTFELLETIGYLAKYGLLLRSFDKDNVLFAKNEK